MSNTVQVLDAGPYYLQDGKRIDFPAGHGLLDGAGGKLAWGADPVYLTFTREQVQQGTATNSAGLLFDRPATPEAKQ